jgi:hypothetical protein
MQAEITATLAGAGFVLAVAIAGGALPAKLPSFLLHSPRAHSSVLHPAAAGPALVVAAATAAGPFCGDPSAHAGRAAPGFPRELPPLAPLPGARGPVAGLAAGIIISADNLVFRNAVGDSHAVTVRPTDPTREFKARVLGMAPHGGMAVGRPDCGRPDRPPAATGADASGRIRLTT